MITLFAGTTQEFSYTHAKYKASDGWSLSLILTDKNANSITLVATADGEDFKFKLDKNVSASYRTGEYQGIYYVSKDNEYLAIDTAVFTIWGIGKDNRTHVKKVLDAIEACIEKRATKDEIDIVRNAIGNSDFELEQNTDKLLAWYEKYKQWYQEELRTEQMKKGLNSRKILTRFV